MMRGQTAALTCVLALLLSACAESSPSEPTEASAEQTTATEAIRTSDAPSTTAPSSTTATTAVPVVTTAASTAVAATTTTTTSTTTTTRPPVICWDGSTARRRSLCPPEPSWDVLSGTDAFGDPIVRAKMISDDADAIIILNCYEDVLSVFVGDEGDLDDGEFAWRPDAPGNATGRYRGQNQEAPASVRWQALVTAAGESTVRGVFLPKSDRRSFIDSLRSGNSLIIDWFYGTDTFEWPRTDTDYEQALEACGW